MFNFEESFGFSVMAKYFLSVEKGVSQLFTRESLKLGIVFFVAKKTSSDLLGLILRIQ